MKKRTLFFIVLLPVFSFSQVNESFNDKNITENPTWIGSTSNFIVNSAFQLQSNVTVTSTSSIFTPSEAFEDASWECWVKIDYTTSSSNYSSIYLTSDKSDISNGCNAYYVQIGGTNDEVSLFMQQGTKKTKIIDGNDKRTDGKPVEMRIKVTRDRFGNFKLYSKLTTETEFVLEGTVTNTTISKSLYFGLLFSNTTSTGNAYYFDEIIVNGEKAIDVEVPILNSVTLELPNKLIVSFSEPIKYTSASFFVDTTINHPNAIFQSNDKTTLELLFDNEFELGVIYTLIISNITDEAGNNFKDSKITVGIAEDIESGDLIINEIMFENPDNSLEYIEMYNKSAKVLDISGVVITTRKTDNTINTGIKITSQLLAPKSYAAFCSNKDSVSNYHNCPDGSNIYTTEWAILNNEAATILLTNPTKEIIYDELTYSSKWHHSLIKNPKGVALERVNTELPTQNSTSWHSASSEVKFGTPGYKNSQFREINISSTTSKNVWLEPEAFSPDNDGSDDLCFIHYKTDNYGFIANVFILNSVGIKIKTLATSVLLSTEGLLTWDGTNDKAMNTNAGIYVLYFEMFNPETGQKKQIKLPIVVSVR